MLGPSGLNSCQSISLGSCEAERMCAGLPAWRRADGADREGL